MTATRHSTGLGLAGVLGGLSAAAVLLNVYAPTVFFDVQIMLGVGLGVYAILEFGWVGLVVGVAALMVTLVRWGHPFSLLVGTGHLIWLKVFLDRVNGGAARHGNGRIVLASIAYWIAVGLPCALAHCTQELGLDLRTAAGLGLKACVTSVFETSLGLVLYKLRRVGSLRSGGETISARGATFATVLMAVTLPGILMTMIVSGQLREAALESRLERLRAAAAPIAARLTADDSPDADVRTAAGSQIAVQARAIDGRVRSSDPELFERLATEFKVEPADTTRVPGLDIYTPRGNLPGARTKQVCYWMTPLDAPAGWSSVTAVQSAPNLVRILDLDLLAPLFALLFGLQLVAAGLAEAMASFVERQFKAVLAPARKPVADGTMPDLDAAAISELNEMVHLVNGHARRVNRLTATLEAARTREQESERLQQAELRQKLKTSLTAAAIAHEIKLPLSNILLGGKLAAERLADRDTTDDALRTIVTGLVAESERVVETIDRMGMLLRSVQTELVPVDVANVIANALLQMADVGGRHEATFVHSGIDVPCMVGGDAIQLQIAVTNLIRNAVQAVAGRPAACRVIEVAVVGPTGTGEATGFAEIVVGDSGPGMLDALAIGVPLSTTKPDGSGIGLYVVRTIAENHGGTLLMGKSPLGGAEFRLRLPVLRIAPKTTAGASP